MAQPASSPLTQAEWITRINEFTEPEPELSRRREEPRALMIPPAPVKLTLVIDEEPIVVRGTLHNVSASGLMVKTSRRLPAQTPLWVEVWIADEKVSLAGQVIHTAQTVGGFKVGIELRFVDNPTGAKIKPADATTSA